MLADIWQFLLDNEPIISSAGAILATAVAVWKLVGLYSGKGVKSPAPIDNNWRNNTWRRPPEKVRRSASRPSPQFRAETKAIASSIKAITMLAS